MIKEIRSYRLTCDYCMKESINFTSTQNYYAGAASVPNNDDVPKGWKKAKNNGQIYIACPGCIHRT